LLALIIIPLPTKIYANSNPSCSLDVTPTTINVGDYVTCTMQFNNCSGLYYFLENVQWGWYAGTITSDPDINSFSNDFVYPGINTFNLTVFVNNAPLDPYIPGEEDVIVCQDTAVVNVLESSEFGMDITSGYSTVIELFNQIEDVSGYQLDVYKYCGSVEEFFSLQDEWSSYMIWPFHIIGQDDPDGKIYENPLSDGGYIAIFKVDAYPVFYGASIEQFTVGKGCPSDKTKGKVIESVTEPQPWVRGDRSMVCYQVWVNDNDCFEFVFFYEYADNNHVFIYDEGGNEVFSIDMPYGDASFEACLADGTYTVKTFHDDMSEPLQEFVIAK
jgi:hypothetical protein